MASLLVAGAGCGPRVENEEMYWRNSQKDMAELGARWPGFKELLEGRLQKAKPLWEAALAVGDTKQKAQQMKEANAALKDGLLTRLVEVKSKSEGITSTIRKMNELRIPASFGSRRRDATAAAQRSIDDVDTAMRAAKPASEEQALKLLEEQISKLLWDGAAADRAYSGLKPEPEKKAKKK
jgi:hypothetical protein